MPGRVKFAFSANKRVLIRCAKRMLQKSNTLVQTNMSAFGFIGNHPSFAATSFARCSSTAPYKSVVSILAWPIATRVASSPHSRRIALAAACRRPWGLKTGTPASRHALAIARRYDATE
jgi:hypothetical protein